MAGDTDLGRILSDLRVTRRSGTYTFVTRPDPIELTDDVQALVREAEGTSVVLSADDARAQGWAVEFEAAWLTLEVHSSLEAVGLTAAVARALADESIPCNVVAGYYHDHLLVPVDAADTALRCIEALAR